MSNPDIWTIVRRALGCACPNCGEGRLFRAYLKQVDACEACGERFGHVRADDAPQWLTILIVGHIVVPAILIVEQTSPWPLWLSMAVWPAVSLALILWTLPRAKALFIAIIWSSGAPGSEVE